MRRWSILPGWRPKNVNRDLASAERRLKRIEGNVRSLLTTHMGNECEMKRVVEARREADALASLCHSIERRMERRRVR